MKLSETKINFGGLLRCCIDTIDTLPSDVEYDDGVIIDCKHETKNNRNIILREAVWQFNA